MLKEEISRNLNVPFVTVCIDGETAYVCDNGSLFLDSEYKNIKLKEEKVNMITLKQKIQGFSMRKEQKLLMLYLKSRLMRWLRIQAAKNHKRRQKKWWEKNKDRFPLGFQIEQE